MRVVIQRVRAARVSVRGETVGRIGRGMLVFVGVEKGDRSEDADALARKVFGLRIFADDGGRMNRSAAEVGASFLVVSQFTLAGDCARGRRPSFDRAAPPAEARRLYEEFVHALRGLGAGVTEGRFRAMMDVSLINDGPVTFVLDASPRDGREG